MARKFQSEIRDSDIRDLLARVKNNGFGTYLRRVKLTKIRAFSNEAVDFDFPVTALIGTNGSGKSTVLGASAIAYRHMRPATFFPKSSLGDDSMSNWSIAYDIIDKSKSQAQISRHYRFKNFRWVRDDLVERPVLHFGIKRTVPAGERPEFKLLASVRYKYTGIRDDIAATVREHASRILGKDITYFKQAHPSQAQAFYVGGDGDISYSEFHFGAGESSIIRMVTDIEIAPENTLVLIEEIENGLHPIATRRMVEYLIDVARRRSIQSIFTTHSEDALLPLPTDSIWYSINGKLRQGRISIEALRNLSDKIEETLAIFVEDNFAKEWVDGIIRANIPECFDQIGVYAVSGEGQAYNIHKSHRKNPAIADKLKSVCILDGNSSVMADEDDGVKKLPGRMPEAEIFDYVHSNIETLAMRLAVGLHFSPEKDEWIKRIVKDISVTNRDQHLIFTQVGQKANLTPSNIVSSAFIGLWVADNEVEAQKIANFVKTNLEQN